MERINHPEQLASWKSEILAARVPAKKVLVISSGTCGQASGSLQIIDVVHRELKKKGILVRYFDKDVLRDYVRITIGTEKQMKALIEAVKEL